MSNISRQMRRHQERQALKGKPAFIGFSTPEPKPSGETLVACALIRDGEVHHGFKSHSDLRGSLGDEDRYQAKRTDEYGFWTSEDRFVTRREAARLIGWTAQRELLSSDVW